MQAFDLPRFGGGSSSSQALESNLKSVYRTSERARNTVTAVFQAAFVR